MVSFSGCHTAAASWGPAPLHSLAAGSPSRLQLATTTPFSRRTRRAEGKWSIGRRWRRRRRSAEGRGGPKGGGASGADGVCAAVREDERVGVRGRQGWEGPRAREGWDVGRLRHAAARAQRPVPSLAARPRALAAAAGSGWGIWIGVG